ncbi:MAG TPA: transcription antitermination factor NusB [Vicinamibacterales bacterium]
MIAPARRAALAALTALERGTDLPAALARTRDDLADERDRALAATIVTGTLRWRARLDALVRQHASRPLDALDPEVLQILRLSIFQLLFLDRVPAAAVVDDAVSLTRAQRKRSAGGFVNAVLRAVSRNRHRIAWPEPPARIAGDADRQAALDTLSVSGSHPRWLIARWVDRLGLEAARAWVAFNNTEPPMILRANRSRTTREELAARLLEFGVETEPATWAPDGLVVRAGNPLRTPLADSGLFLVQDEASQIVPLAAGVRPGMRVLDACAAPGGKTLALDDALRAGADSGTPGLLVAADFRERRLRVLRTLLTRHGSGARLVQHDLTRGVPFGDVFDRVLVDAPCTGLGTLRRDVDIRWKRREEDIHLAAGRQRAMIAQAAQAVAPGGRLVYATCSSEPEENDGIVDEFLASRPDFVRVPRERLVEDGVPEALLDGLGILRTRPDRHGLEPFFAAALERTRRRRPTSPV